MPLLYYWRGDNHTSDLDNGAGYHLNQSNPLLHQVALGDSLWAFTRRARDNAYVMAAELVIRGKTHNPRGFAYGPYRVWGDLERSRYFRVEGQKSIETLLRSLSPAMKAARLGQSFQGHAAVRRLTPEDHALLTVACQSLPLEPRARLLPEDQLEYSLLDALPAQTPWLLSEVHGSGLALQRRTYLSTQAPLRSRPLVQRLQALYQGQCQLCGWSSAGTYGVSVAEAHHLQWLSRGGADVLENLILLCPNHHRAAHACDAHFDFQGLCMDFGSGQREPLRLDVHLTPLAA